MNKLIVAGICFFLSIPQVSEAQHTAFEPGKVWNDTEGNPINAHGGGILYHEGTYYWYGEYKKGKTVLPEWATWECYRTDVTGVSCYSSKDLLNWKFEGIVLPAVKDDPNHDLHPSKVLERPKVIYNRKTGKFVMWAHVESADYSKACAGVAVSDSPAGPFTYLGSFRPNDAMSRDQTVFVDDDGRAYQFYSSENNATMYISLLTDDYLKPSGRFTRNFIKQSREAPAVFKHDGKYYLDYFRMYRVGPECSGDSRCRFGFGRMENNRKPLYRTGCGQDFLCPKHVCAACGREEGCLYRPVRPVEQDGFGELSLRMASRLD